MVLNALDYPDLAAAIADAKDGDRIYVPGVKRWRAPAGGWQITKSLQIYGDGPGDPGIRLGTVLEPFGLDNDVLVLKPPTGANALGHVYIHDLMICGREGVNPDGKSAIRIVLDQNQSFESLRLDRVAVINMSVEGLSLSQVKRLSMKKVTVGSCHSYGMVVDSVGLAHLTSCSCGNNLDFGLECYYSASVVTTSNVENNPTSGLSLYSCPTAVVHASRFEDAAPPSQFVKCNLVDCQGAVSIVGCYFATGFKTPPYTTIGIRMNQNCRAITLLPNVMERPTPTVIDFDSANVGCSVWPQRQVTGGVESTAGINLPDVATASLLANPSVYASSLEVADLTGGLVVPSQATVPAASSFPPGVIYYVPQDGVLDQRWGLRLVIAGAWRIVELLPA